jgi:hypothetical protein
MPNLGLTTNSNTDGVLSMEDVVRDSLLVCTLPSARYVDFNTIRLLAEPYSSNVSSIEPPDDYHHQWDLAGKLAYDMTEAALALVNHQQTTAPTRQFIGEELQLIANHRQSFLEQALLVSKKMQDTASKILAVAGLSSSKNADSRPKKMADQALSRLNANVEYFEKALKHNRTLLSF